ncbi:MAG: DMT family transporter [Pseudomonadota bacterium]|jgi:drug/metabolite transporter (DMT)-like permease
MDKSFALLKLVPGFFVLLWSTGFIGAKLGLPYAEPLTFLLVRFAVVIAILLAMALALARPWPRQPRQYLHMAVAGTLLHGGYLSGVFCAIGQGMSAGVVALIVGVQPLLTAMLSGSLVGEQVTRRQWLGLVLGFGGVALVVWQKLEWSGLGLAGLAFAVMALLSITLGTLYQKRFCSDLDLWTGSVVQFAAAAAVVLPFALRFEAMEIRWSGPFLFALGWLVLVLSLGAISLLHILIRRGAATRVSALFYLTPPTTAVMAFLVFGERLSALAVLGMAVTAAGVALAVARK